MNIQNYILPVSIAATIHVALLMYGVKEPARPHIKVIEVPLPPLPPKPDDLVMKPEEKTETEEPVTPLAGGPTLPSIDDHPMTPKATDITIPQDDPIRKLITNISTIPPTVGPDGDPMIDHHVSMPGIFSPKQLDRIPYATVQRSPNYPAAMQQSGITGSVTVEFDVDTQGRVTRAEAIKYTHREFVEPAVRAVLQWHFEPGKRNGRPVPFRMAIPIEFSLPAD